MTDNPDEMYEALLWIAQELLAMIRERTQGDAVLVARPDGRLRLVPVELIDGVYRPRALDVVA